LASELETSPIRLNTSLAENVVAEEDFRAESPRTKVAHRFENLQLGSTAVGKLGLKQFEIEAESDPDSEALPKRLKTTELVTEIPETPREVEPLQTSLDPVIFKGAADPFSSSLVRAYPSINRLMDSKSRGLKKSSRSPHSASGNASIQLDATMDIDRASLTWHDDEITGHDPDDPEDDGEGINGIGFKPTPAMAHARAERRKQQLAEYRSREAREARAKRSERRRGSPTLMVALKDNPEPVRKVRFMEELATSEMESSMTA